MLHARRDEHTLYELVKWVIDELAICPDNMMVSHSEVDNNQCSILNCYKGADILSPNDISFAIAEFWTTRRASRPS